MKKFISMILSLAVLVSSTVVFAQSTKIKGISVEAKTGETVEIVFEIENNPGISEFDIKLRWDKSVLSLTDSDVSLGGAFDDGDVTEDRTVDGKYNITWTNDSDVSADGVLFTLEFDVSDSAKIQNYFISIGVNKLVNSEGNEFSADLALPGVSITEIVDATQTEAPTTAPTTTPTASPRPTKKPSSGGGGSSIISTPKPTATPTVAPTEAPTEKPDDENDVFKPLFDDIKSDDWYHDNVMYVFEKGLMSGVSDTEFGPQVTLTRAMLVTVLWRLEGEPVVNYLMQFTDVEAESYYQEAVRWASAEGIVNGVTDTEFAPHKNITREQIATIMHRYAQYKSYDVSVGENTNILSYDDASDVSEYAISAIQYAVGSGLITGKTDSTLNPKDNATRAEIATILKRFITSNE